MIQSDNFTDIYIKLANSLNFNCEYTSNPRGLMVKENLCSSFILTNPLNRIPYVKGRNFSPRYLIGELLWYLSANDETSKISRYSKFWQGISQNGKAASAYGARIFKEHDRIAGGKINQWESIVNELIADKHSRRAVLHIKDQSDTIDGNGRDVPCTLTLQFFIRNDELHLCANMRSTDLIFGLTYDVPAFTLFQEILCQELRYRKYPDLKLGKYYHTSNSLHVYEKHFKMLNNICDLKNTLKSSIRSEIAKKTQTQIPNNLPYAKLYDDVIFKLLGFENCVFSLNDDGDIINFIYDELKKDTLNVYWHDWMLLITQQRLNSIKSPYSVINSLVTEQFKLCYDKNELGVYEQF